MRLLTEAENAAEYISAETLLTEGKTAEAAIAFGKMAGYKDARERSFELWNQVAHRQTISSELNHAVGLLKDGTVIAAGENSEGQCYDVRNWTDIVAVYAGTGYTYGLHNDGTVEIEGNYEPYDFRPGLDVCMDIRDWTDIVAITASAGLRIDGTVVPHIFDLDQYFEIIEWTDIVQISDNGNHLVGLRSDGTVVAAGNIGGWNDYGQYAVEDWTDIVAVSAGNRHTVGLRSDGTVVAVGSDGIGQCDVSGWTDIVAVGCGYSHTVALRSDGTVVAVGNNTEGQCNVSNWTDIVAIAVCGFSTVGYRSDGTVVFTGSSGYGMPEIVRAGAAIELPQ